MAKDQPPVQPINLQNLLIDLQNPRYEPQHSQREALATIALEQGEKLANLAEDIADKGLNPSEVPIVTESEEPGKFRVLEGNRRIAAVKLLAQPALLAKLGLPDRLVKRFAAAHAHAQGTLPDTIYCAIVPPEDVRHWLHLRHTGENEGVGIVSWDAIQARRFRGASPGLQAIELVMSKGYLDEATKKKVPKIAITNIERVLATPKAREYLGVGVRDGTLVLGEDEDEALGRLALLVTDVANKEVKVWELLDQDQRIDYARKLSRRPLPRPIEAGGAGTGAAGAGATRAKTGAGRRLPTVRTTLIPKRFKVPVGHPRLNRIYHELQNLKVEKFRNCCAVTFRVLLELSVDDFAIRHKIPLVRQQAGGPAKRAPSKSGDRDMSLREKLKTIAKHLEDNSICTRAELKGVRVLSTQTDHFLSVDSFNAYVHNKDFNPTPDSLTTAWDNVQTFVERIWTT